MVPQKRGCRRSVLCFRYILYSKQHIKNCSSKFECSWPKIKRNMACEQRSKFWLSVHPRPPKNLMDNRKYSIQLSVDNHKSVAKTNLCTCIFIYSKYRQPKSWLSNQQLSLFFLNLNTACEIS